MNVTKPPHAQDHALRAVVGIGGSAGGIAALSTLLDTLPADTGLTFVAVLHLSAQTADQVADVLSQHTAMPVMKTAHAMRPQANHIYVASPDCSIAFENGEFKIGPPRGCGTHQIDAFFESLAAAWSARAIGVLLSGASDDGVIGLCAIKLSGGITFAQDASAQYPRLPRAAVEAGCVDTVISPAGMAKELSRLTGHPQYHSTNLQDHCAAELEPLITALRAQCGMDFSKYKTSTLYRRSLRRMALGKYTSIQHYAAVLTEDPHEAHALVQDILIGVTEFFRDPAAFEDLKKALPAMLQGRPHEQRRIWLVGCSTGEEAYSVAMVLEELAPPMGYQVFATDLNPAALVKARRGIYPKSIERSVTPDRLQRFFEATPDGYRIVQAVRRRINFSPHNVLTDPPFQRIDLLCCRNLMIYIDQSSIRKLLTTLYRALRPQGMLFLGAAEDLGPGRELFTAIDQRHRIFSKRPNAVVPDSTDAASGLPAVSTPRPQHSSQPSDARLGKALREGERQLVHTYAPPGVFVDARFEVLQYLGTQTSLYLTNHQDQTTTNLLRMTREGLLVPLRSALQQALRSASAVLTPRITVHADGQHRETVVRVIPVHLPDSPEPYFWVMFEPASAAVRAPATGKREPAAKPAKSQDLRHALDQQLERIEQQSREIRVLREEMQNIIDQHEAVQETLRAANEELQSNNEELLRANTELLDSQHGLQSAVEELRSVNTKLGG